jgi:hypothetical protein
MAEVKQNKRQTEKFVFEFMDMLSAPILTHSIAWKDAIPQRLIKEITLYRLIAGMQKEELATLPETVAFIMTRSFDAPMDHDWTDIYTHVSCTVCEQCWGEDHWEHVKAPRILNQYQAGMLKHLRQWIYRRRRMHVKSVTHDGSFTVANESYNFKSSSNGKETPSH